MDRFSEEEARRIFADASRATADGDSSHDGLTLAELQEIGRAAGIDPAAIAAAAGSVRHTPGVPTWRGVPLATRRTRLVPGPLSDDVWAAAVSDFRRTFKVQGVTEQIGGQRTWAHVVGEGVQVVMVRITAEPVGNGTRVTIESGEQGDGTAANVMSSIIALCGILFGVAVGLKESAGAGFAVAAGFLAVALAFYAVIRWSAVRRSHREPVRFDAVLDRVARLAAPDASVAPTAPDLAPEPAAPEPAAPLPVAPGLVDLVDPLPSDDDLFLSSPRRARA